MKNLRLKILAIVLPLTMIVTSTGIMMAQSDQSPARLGEEKYQELKAKGLLPLNETFTQLHGVTNPDRTPLTITPRELPQKPKSYSIKPGDDPNAIEVKFLDNLSIEIGTKGYPVDRMAKSLKFNQVISLFENISQAGGRWKRMAGAPEEKINSLRAVAEMKLGRAIANLNNYFILTVPKGVSIKVWIDKLNALPEVEIALPLPLPTPPPLPPNYQGLQGYLNPATDGIDASYAWTLPGGTGTNTTICDLEYSWNLNHQDLPTNIATWIPSGYTASDPYNDNNHGTAVLGQIVSLNNGWGTTGAVYGATATVAPTYLNNVWSLGTAMTYAISNMVPGDVILIEQQFGGPRWPGGTSQFGCIPVEWWQSWYNVILTAVGNGIHVVAAAGNGEQNLDDPIYSTGNNGNWPFLPQNNSGAIIVGAGAAPAAFGGSDTNRSRLWFSNYGSRVDLQGWGECVRTTGYEDLYNAEGINLRYTDTFGGTSSASPIVAAAVALVESRFEYLYPSQTISPLTMRSILNNTGSPQQSGTYPATQNIGPLPNVQSALQFAPQPGANLPCRTYGTDLSERAFALVQSSDFGYVLAGWTTAFTTPGNTNVLIVRIDSAGNLVSPAKISVGGLADQAYSMVTTTDGGYAVTGWTRSYGAGGSDIFVLKLDVNLNLQWGRVYSGLQDDQAYSIIQTGDGGYALTGWTNSFGEEPFPNIIVIKLFSNGDVQWAKAYARQVLSHIDEGYGIIEIPGGYAVVGRFYCTYDPNWDAFLMYLDTMGNLLGTQVLYGPKDDEAYSVTFDGNIEVAGWTGTYGPGALDTANIFVAKFPSTPGPPIWSNVYGWEKEEKVMDDKSLIVTNDGNYAVSGWTYSRGPGAPQNPNFLIMKLNSSNGSVIWSRVHPSIPGAKSEEAYPMIQTFNGGYAIAGWTNSFGLGGDDFHFLTLDPNGNRPVCVLDSTPLMADCPWMSEVMYEWEADPATTGMHLIDAMVESMPVCPIHSTKVDSFSYFKGWNMISVPLVVSDYRKTSLFPTAQSSAFTYQGSYVIRDTLKNGVGYWLKFSSSQSIPMDGLIISEDSINVSSGWNMIGSISNPVATSSITTEPPGIIRSQFYGYKSGYFITDTIQPGKGYWIKVNLDGKLFLYSDGVGKTAKLIASENLLNEFNSLTIIDANGNEQKLFFGKKPNGDFSLDFYEMPPLSPVGIFDARFASNRMLEAVDSGKTQEYPISLSSPEYPIKIHWELKQKDITAYLRIDDKEIPLRSSGNSQIAHRTSHIVLKLSGFVDLPKTFALEQNYPNPFNPTTVIHYQLPVESKVAIRIYNVLGQEVKTLVDDIQVAGYQTAQWDSRNNVGNAVASGVYFYRLEATSVNDPSKSFVQVKKMILLR
ncbi:MAG: S8 family serine peptidase [Bacteroidota bacterium]|nr:S8 family serine peptidase [Bacteroidota bacterium]